MAAPHIPLSLDDAKRLMRQRARAERDAAGLDPIGRGLALGGHLLAACPPPAGSVVAGFWPLGAEIDVRPLLFALHLRGHPIALPETPPRGQPLVFRAWRPGQDMIPERFGTMRPTGAVVVPEVLLVPLLAFDLTCHRLGYGGGYYDRTLATLPHALTIGCAFAHQAVDAVPVGPYDVPLHAIATEAGMIIGPT